MFVRRDLAAAAADRQPERKGRWLSTTQAAVERSPLARTVANRAGAGGRWAWAGPPLALWLLSRLGVVLVMAGATQVLRSRPAVNLPGFLVSWRQWDVELFIKVARDGYLSPGTPTHTEVDFPGLPLLLRLVHVVVPDWTGSGLVISLLAGAVASLALWRLAGPADQARRAVLYLVLAPYAVFLFAGYSEPLFLAFTVTAWLVGRQGRWWLAALLGAGATGTRLVGLAFAAGLVVEYLVTRYRVGARGRALLDWQAPFFLVMAIPVIAYVGYLHARTGNWNQYSVAMKAGWGRTVAAPWSGARVTWELALNSEQNAQFLWFWRAEVLAVVVGVVLSLVLARQRRWGETVYVAATTLIFASSSYWASGVRAVLVMFPLYLLLARATIRRPALHPLVVTLCAPLMALFVVVFTTGGWVD